MQKGGPYEKILRSLSAAQEEVKRLAEELAQVLRTIGQADYETATWLEVVQEWENAETISAALRMCLKIASERDALTERNLSRQLRHWLREEGKGERGWLEVRTVGGHGPYVYYRWRNPGEREIQTEYYGRGDRLLSDLAAGPAVSRASRKTKEKKETAVSS